MTKRSVKAKSKRGATRDLFAELSEGMKALSEERLGKRTPRTYPQRRPRRPPSRASGADTLSHATSLPNVPEVVVEGCGLFLFTPTCITPHRPITFYTPFLPCLTA